MLGVGLLLQDVPPPPELPGGGYGVFLLESLLILVAVCVFAWVVIRFGLKRLPGMGAASGPLKMVARLSLEPRRTLYVIEAGGKMLLVGTSDNGPMATLAELDPGEVNAAIANMPARKSFAELLREKMAARRRSSSGRHGD